MKDNFTILHISSISNNKCNGVCTAVPQHIIAQSKYANVGSINVKKEHIDSFDDNMQLKYNNRFNIKDVKEPFNKPDLVVFHECYQFEYIKISKNLKKNSIPYIIVPHGSLRNEAQQKKKIKKVLGNIVFFNKFIRNSIGIQCLAQNEYNNTNFENEKKFIETNGVNIPLKRKESFNNEKIKFTYIGRLEVHVKGIDLMIKAIKQKADLMRSHNCTLDIYGPDIYGRYKKVEELIKHNNVEDIVNLHHEITEKEKEETLLNTDVFIQTSRHEGMPLGILESLSYGIPCIVTEGTNLGTEIKKYNAGWFAENTSESIAQKIYEAINDKNKYYEYGNNAIKLIKDAYNWDKIGKETVDRYRQMINKIK